LIIENFKAFRHLEMELAPLTILLGANSTGKSILLLFLAGIENFILLK